MMMWSLMSSDAGLTYQGHKMAGDDDDDDDDVELSVSDVGLTYQGQTVTIA